MSHPGDHAPPVNGEERTEEFRPLIFGEALFDHFPDGSKVLGGAPFNVAWHLQGFKASPLVVTAVGDDPDGAEILRRMAGWGMDTSGVQVHPVRPTGRVTAHLERGEPHYEIEARQAYDAVSVEALPPPDALEATHLLYHGSLGVREETSASSLAHLRRTLGVPTLLDVNLRDPWWTRATLDRYLGGTTWVKVNRLEAGLLSGLPVQDTEQLSKAATTLRQKHGIGTLVVTRGEEGAVAVAAQGIHWMSAPAVSDFVDPVGAGDAFSAVLALGIHGGWELETMLRRAVEFAAELCRIRGATSEDRELYARHLRRWTDAA